MLVQERQTIDQPEFDQLRDNIQSDLIPQYTDSLNSVFYSFVGSKTVLGRHIYALGGNEKAVRHGVPDFVSRKDGTGLQSWFPTWISERSALIR